MSHMLGKNYFKNLYLILYIQFNIELKNIFIQVCKTSLNCAKVIFNVKYY